MRTLSKFELVSVAGGADISDLPAGLVDELQKVGLLGKVLDFLGRVEISWQILSAIHDYMKDPVNSVPPWNGQSGDRGNAGDGTVPGDAGAGCNVSGVLLVQDPYRFETP